ncbi:MAG: tRNA (adenosine(37)-N6)-dimethylallyltransferase MiaA [Pseudomonadota bacterium]
MTALHKLPVVVLLGPTAAGKTAVAMALQDLLGKSRTQLISVDSAMVYRGMDIGSAKPTAAELADYPHALIDIRDPAEPYNAADFVTDADRAIQAALAAERVPVLVGGTMLYARCFLEGIAALPDANQATREQLERDLQEHGDVALHAELAAVDSQAAAGIDPRNHQRLLRALEVVRLTGQPISELWESHKGTAARARLGVKTEVFAVTPVPRHELHARIHTRFQQMLTLGFLDEVARLKQREDLHIDLPAMRAVGYRQAWLHLQGSLDYAQFVADAQTATRRLAKRQLTWLRRWPDLQALTVEDAQAQAQQLATEVGLLP